MKVWVDKQGGTHYHKEDCGMTKDPKFHYEPVEVSEELVKLRRGILIHGQRYTPCACLIPRRHYPYVGN